MGGERERNVGVAADQTDHNFISQRRSYRMMNTTE